MSDYTRSNIAAIVDAVSATMAADGQGPAVTCELGNAQRAASGAPPRIVWVPDPKKPITFQAPKIQPADGVVILDALEPFIVSVIGSDVNAARVMVDRLLVALNTAFGVNAQYPISMVPSPDRVTSTAYAYDVSVTLKIPVYRYRYTQVTAGPGEQVGTVSAGDTSEEITS